MSSAFRKALKFARETVANGRGQVNNQVGVVEQQVMRVLESYLTQVAGGAWKGAGANAFNDVVRNDMMTMMRGFINTLQTTNTNQQRAIDIIDDADRQVKTAVGQLHDTFRSI